jgi:hypothetical protein
MAEANVATEREIGEIRFCSACGRRAFRPAWAGVDDENEGMRCGCCERPFHACPCTPAEDGPCLAAVPASCPT